MKKIVKKTQNKKNYTITKGNIYISATFNNTIITLTDEKGSPFLIGSCGMYGYSGTRKSTPYAATITVSATIKKAMEANGLKDVEVYIKGIGPGREASLRAIKALGLNVLKLLDVTPVPHNGVRPPKQKRG